MNFEEIEGFKSPRQYRSFIEWLNQKLKDKEIIELTNSVRMMQTKRQFEVVETKERWELLVPDPGYFQGSWRKTQ